jgi:hypothetical protein
LSLPSINTLGTRDAYNFHPTMHTVSHINYWYVFALDSLRNSIQFVKHLQAPLGVPSTLIPSCLILVVYPFLHLPTTTSPTAPPLHMPSATPLSPRLQDFGARTLVRRFLSLLRQREKESANELTPTMTTHLNLTTVMPPQRSKVVMVVVVQVLGTTRSKI